MVQLARRHRPAEDVHPDAAQLAYRRGYSHAAEAAVGASLLALMAGATVPDLVAILDAWAEDVCDWRAGASAEWTPPTPDASKRKEAK